MIRLLPLVAVIFLFITMIPTVHSQVNNCEFESTVECDHFTAVSATETMKISDIVDFEISGDGEHILYTDSEKYNLVDVDDLRIINSDFLMPNEQIGTDGYTGNVMVHDGQHCFFPEFPDETNLCVLNETKLISSTISPPGTYMGAYHSHEYVICDLDHSQWFTTHCDSGVFVNENEKDGKSFSPDGKYEIWFSSFLTDDDMFTDDYDGVVSYGEVLNWEINSENITIAEKSITRILGGFHLESYLKDDVYSIVWSLDSKYAYVVTCKEIYGVDVVDHTVEAIGTPPITCDSEWDSVDDEVSYIHKPAKISMDGSTLIYVDGSKLVIIELSEGWSPGFLTLGIAIILVAMSVPGYRYLKRREII